jgi:hypothetical protein
VFGSVNSEWSSGPLGISGNLAQTFASKSETLELVAGIRDELMSILPPLSRQMVGNRR